MKPGVKITFDNFHYINLVTGHQLTVVNPDTTRTYVGLYLHENRLYVLDATVARNAPAPIIFQQSLEFLDAEGKSIRYRTYYFDKLPEAKLGRRGAGQGTQDPGAPPNAGPGQGGGRGGRGGAPPERPKPSRRPAGGSHPGGQREGKGPAPRARGNALPF